MKIFKDYTLTWWQASLLKVCLISLGMLIGIYFYNFVVGLIWLWWILFIITGIYFIIYLLSSNE
jgi:hypothetical protein